MVLEYAEELLFVHWNTKIRKTTQPYDCVIQQVIQ